MPDALWRLFILVFFSSSKNRGPLTVSS